MPEDAHGLVNHTSEIICTKPLYTLLKPALGPFSTLRLVLTSCYKMQHISENDPRKAMVRASLKVMPSKLCISTFQTQCASAQSQLGTYYSAFRTMPYVSQSLNHSWTAPLVAPPLSSPVTEPTAYKFASRAPVVRRFPTASAKASATKQSRPNHPQLPPPSAARKLPSSSASSAYHPYARSVSEPLVPLQYDEFLASFQHRIDGMTGQKGGWGF
jgi:hypothetical protein